MTEAGAVLAGGHSVDDREPKYGLAVTGVVHPDRVLANAGAQPGDALVLTKPLGSGVIFNANRAGKLSLSMLEEVLPIVAALNGTALETALGFEVHGLTDITGFGFAGHALEMATQSKVRMRISFGKLPIYPGAVEMYAAGIDTGSILCQGAYTDADSYGFYWRFLGHRALLDGLPHMKASLDALYERRGQFEPVSQEGRESRNHSWIRMTEYVAYRLRALLSRRSAA